MGLDCYLQYHSADESDNEGIEIWYGRKTWQVFDYFIDQSGMLGDANCEILEVHDPLEAAKDIKIMLFKHSLGDSDMEDWHAEQLPDLITALEEYADKPGNLTFYGWY